MKGQGHQGKNVFSLGVSMGCLLQIRDKLIDGSIKVVTKLRDVTGVYDARCFQSIFIYIITPITQPAALLSVSAN